MQNTLFGDSIIDFRYDIFDINNKYTKEELLNKKSITAAIFLLDQTMTPHEYLDRIKSIALDFDKLDNKKIQALKHWIENSMEEGLAIDAVNILNSNKEEVLNMVSNNAFIVTEMKNRSREEGIEKGKLETKIEIAKNLLSENMDVPFVAKISGLPIEEVEKLKAEQR